MTGIGGSTEAPQMNPPPGNYDGQSPVNAVEKNAGLVAPGFGKVIFEEDVEIFGRPEAVHGAVGQMMGADIFAGEDQFIVNGADEELAAGGEALENHALGGF